jgi:hypothetical protein
VGFLDILLDCGSLSVYVQDGGPILVEGDKDARAPAEPADDSNRRPARHLKPIFEELEQFSLTRKLSAFHNVAVGVDGAG